MQLKEGLGRLKEKLERKLKENWRLKERPKRRSERNLKERTERFKNLGHFCVERCLIPPVMADKPSSKQSR